MNRNPPFYVADAPGMDGKKLAALASCDPITYFSLMETFCRRGPPSEYICCLLCLPQLLTGEGHQQLLVSWQHYKACISAFASWVKTYIRDLKAIEAAPGGVDHRAGLVMDNGVVSVKRVLDWLMMQLDARYTGWAEHSRSTEGGGLLQQLRYLGVGSDERQATVSTTILVLLVLVSRAVAETLEVLGRLLQKLVDEQRAACDTALSDPSSSKLPSGSRIDGSSSNSARGSTSASEQPQRQPVAAVARVRIRHEVCVLSLFHYNALMLWQKAATGDLDPARSRDTLEVSASSSNSGSISSSCSQSQLSCGAVSSSSAAAAGNAACNPLQPDHSEIRSLRPSTGAAAANSQPPAYPRPETATAPAALLSTLGAPAVNIPSLTSSFTITSSCSRQCCSDISSSY